MQLPHVIGARFELRSLAGHGGVGTVYRARDLTTGRTVAIKLLDRHHRVDAERFAREAEVLAALEHPGIVRYVDHGIDDDERHFLAMEWLEGEDLATRLARQGLDAREAVTVVRASAQALATAHRAGIVHRDIKPANIFLIGGDPGRVRLIDFGMARVIGGDLKLTRTGTLLGTPEFMAPEQARGEVVDARADVFSLGCVLYACLTGVSPFQGGQLIQVMLRILSEAAPPLRTWRPDLPVELETLVQQLLAKRKEARPPDGAAVDALLAALPLASADPIRQPSRPVALGLTALEQRVLTVILLAPPLPAQSEAQTISVEEPASLHAPAIDALVSHHGGILAQLAGGTRLACFHGQASDVLLDRAAHCALELQGLLPDSRLLLATGRGVLEARLPSGEVLDRALHLLHTWPPPSPGQPVRVRLDAVTARLLGDRFRIADEDGLLWLSHADPTSGQPDRHPRAPCLGREVELSRLAGALTASLTQPRARAVLVQGSAGVGKSRLVTELLRALHPGAAHIVQARATASTQPWHAIASLLRRATELPDGPLEGPAMRALQERLGAALDPHEVTQTMPFLTRLAGVPVLAVEPDASPHSTSRLAASTEEPRWMAEAMRRAWVAWLTAALAQQPLVLVLDDAHLADGPSLDLLLRAVRSLPDQPLFVVLIARPEIALRPQIAAGQDPAAPLETHAIDLPSVAACEQLARVWLGDEADPARVRALVHRSGRDPRFLEELCRAAHAGGHPDALPDTLLTMLQARLDALPADTRRVLRAASVFGPAAAREAVRSLVPDLTEADFAASLAHLVAEGMLAAESRQGRAHLAFRHDLWREAAYAMLTEADRLLGHRLAARWLVAQPQPEPAALAEHFLRAQQDQEAVLWLSQAAHGALLGHDFHGAVACAARASPLTTDAATRAELSLLRAEAFGWLGDPVAARQHAQDAVARSAPGSAAWFRAVSELVRTFGRLDDFDAGLPWLRRLARAEAQADAEDAQIIALGRCNTMLVHGGCLEMARVTTSALEKLSRKGTTDPAALAQIHGARVFQAVFQGYDVYAAIRHAELEVAAHVRARAERDATLARVNVGFMHAQVGDYALAVQQLRQAIERADELGLPYVSALGRHNLGCALLQLQRATEAEALQTFAFDQFSRQGNRRLAAAALVELSRIHHHRGAPHQALDLATRALAVAGDNLYGRLDGLWAQGLAWLDLDPVLALPPLAQASDAVRDRPALAKVKLHVTVAHAEVLIRLGEWSQARDTLTAAMSEVQQVLATCPDQRARRLLLARPTHIRLLDLLAEVEDRAQALPPAVPAP